MALIKECRELRRLNVRTDALRLKQSSNLQNDGDKKQLGLMRSIDSLDELEESDLSRESGERDDIMDSDKSVSTPSASDEEVQDFMNHDLDGSCDSYGVRLVEKEQEEFPDGLPEVVEKVKPRKLRMLNNFVFIEQSVVLAQSQSCDIILQPSKKDRRASIVPVVRPNFEELLQQKTFMRQNSMNVGTVMQLTRLNLNRMSSSDFSKASENVRVHSSSVAVKRS